MTSVLTRFNSLKQNRKKGFTMVEMIIVIVIIAILIAVVTPAVLGVLDRANRVADQADAQSILMAAGVAGLDQMAQPTAEQILGQLVGDGSTLHSGLVVDVFFDGIGVIGVRIVSGGRSSDSNGVGIGAPGAAGASEGRVQVTIPDDDDNG